ncbi:MAG: hypothetical protein QCI38_01365 [Candidatus Thermoplasmatota archaeon]|nr:hypothetical protein [Candidatus Thermoplasmatota archaeon]
MLVGLFLIISGLVLLTGILRAIPALGEHLEKLSKGLGAFQTAIGVIAIIIGVLNLGGIGGIVLLLAGLILAIGILPAIPALGENLEKISKILAGVQTPIGVIALLWGVLSLLGMV